jgi:hypothetical protein
MKRIHEQSNTNRATTKHGFPHNASEFAEAVEDHQSNQEEPEDHSRDEEGQPVLHERIQGRHLG